MTQETQTARVHSELVSMGFETLPLYDFEPYDLGRSSGGFLCIARLKTSADDFVAHGEPMPTKQYAKSSAAVTLLDLIKQVQSASPAEKSGPLPPPRAVRPGFLSPEPVVQFGPGEVKEIKDLVRPVGVAYLREALHFYEQSSALADDDTTPCLSLPRPPSVECEEPLAVGEVQPVPLDSGPGGDLHDEELSRLMAMILRYHAKELGLDVDMFSYVPVDQLMMHLPRKYSVSDVSLVVRNSKHRDGVPRFRAKYHPLIARGLPDLGAECFYVRSTRKVSMNEWVPPPQRCPPPGLVPLARTKTIDPNRNSV